MTNKIIVNYIINYCGRIACIMELKVGNEYTGEEVQETGKEFYRLTNEEECHNEFQYKTGLNVDPNEFDPSGSCKKGGLYFFCREQLLNHTKYTDDIKYIRRVKLPNHARVYVEEGKFKADTFILGERSIFNLIDHIDYKTCLEAVKSIGSALKYVPEKLKTKEMCLIAVKHDYKLIMYVPEEFKTEEMCSIAVQYCGIWLKYVPEEFKTEEMCLIAVKTSNESVKYVPEKLITGEMCLIAVKSFGLALRYVPEELKTEEMFLIAVKDSG